MTDLHKEVALLSLDDYIKKSKMDGIVFNNGKKNKQSIDKYTLNSGLDKIDQNNTMKRSQRSKFDRFMDDEDSSSEDEEKLIERTSSNIQMLDINDLERENSSIRFAKELQQMEHPKCCQIKNHFKTIENENGIKIPSQQWRIEKQRKSRWDERPHPIKVGRVKKTYKKTELQTKTGFFVEKKIFTYKFADVDAKTTDKNEEILVDIVRNKPKFVNNYHIQRGNQSININLNFDGIVHDKSNGSEEFTLSSIDQRVSSTNVDDDVQINIPAQDHFQFLRDKRGKASQPTNVKRMLGNERNKTNEYIISATAGEGIENIAFVPNATNLPLNLRFA